MHLDGTKEDIKLIELVVNEMMLTINNKGFVEPEDIRNYLASMSNDEPASMNGNEDEPIVLHTHKGAVRARTGGQVKYFEAVKESDIVFAIGPAGTGKTYQAVAMAVSALKSKAVDRIIITRPAVEAGESLGFLPGDLQEKVDPYLAPLYDSLRIMLPGNKLAQLLERKSIEVVPLAYMRGRTMDSAYMILDEAQNATVMQMKMFLTRLGIGSRAIVTGDITQIDLQKQSDSGLVQVANILKDVEGIGFVMLDKSDVVRHPLVMKIIQAYDEKIPPKKKS